MRKLSPVGSLVAVAATMSLVGLAPARAQQAAGGQPGTQWSDAQLREAIGVARVGRKLTPKTWPNGARVAVNLSFDADSEAPLLRDGNTSPTALSAADFGAQSGMPRRRSTSRTKSSRAANRRDSWSFRSTGR